MHLVRNVTLAIAGALVGGCGGKPHPKPPDPKLIAAELDADMRELDAIATRLEGKCEPLVAALRPHVAKMRAHVEQVKLAMTDPAFGPQLKAEMKAYDERHATLHDSTGESLGRSYAGCNKDQRLIDLVDQIPVL